MIEINATGAYYVEGQLLEPHDERAQKFSREEARRTTMTHAVLRAHSVDTDSPEHMRIRFDALASHDITYVGIVQTARASGMKRFPVPYVLTNCHNSLCAVGGTINEDDHIFGLSAARKYGAEFVPAHLAVIHQYMREVHAACGTMILGSDSHTRYGALGCMGIGEGGPELVKQLLSRTYDLATPEVVAVYLEGAPRPGVGPQDVALAMIKTVFAQGLVKNKVLEFIGPGIGTLSVDYRMGIDVMTTETTCLSSLWQTDEHVRQWLTTHGRPEAYTSLIPGDGAWYDMVVKIDLSAVEPMIALPFHPSNAWTIREFLANAEDLLAVVEEEGRKMVPKALIPLNLRSKLRNGGFYVDQGIVAGCSGGTFENLALAARVLRGASTTDGQFSLALYPASQPQYLELIRQGIAAELMEAGAVLKTAFCGPCFGAGDVPGHNCFSIRHTTRNFPSREGAKPGEGQLAFVALMDARSIAATAANQGRLTPATELAQPPAEPPHGASLPYAFDAQVYTKRVYRGFAAPRPEEPLIFGPNIADWPSMPALPENLLLLAAAVILDPVTTTDELIPSGETSSFRSNPLRLAEFTLSRKDPAYVGRAKQSWALEKARRQAIGQVDAQSRDAGISPAPRAELDALFARLGLSGQEAVTGIGSVVLAVKPGDGSAREQAASCQKVLSGWANIALEYATKRYRSNLVNWGMLPLVVGSGVLEGIEPGDAVILSGVRKALESGAEQVSAELVKADGTRKPLRLLLPGMTQTEREIILAGCLMNYYRTMEG